MKEKLNLPTELTAIYKIITPMFIGDAEQKATAISPQSFKGVLRFWWRALMWGKIRQKYTSDEAALKELHHLESILFGGIAVNPKSKNQNGEPDGKTYGRGKFSLQIQEPERLPKRIADWPGANRNSPSAYLAMGITKSGSEKEGNLQEHREAVPEQISFNVRFVFDKDMTQADIASLKDALKLIGFFGGMGSRARRAFGALQLLELGDERIHFDNPADYMQQANALLAAYKLDVAPYTAISKKSQLQCAGEFINARAAHSGLGELYKNYRGQPSALRGEIKKVFGLPLQDVDLNARRGSPLFFHIVELSNKKYAYSILYLPSSIFHKDAQHNKVDYRLLEGFMDKVAGEQA